MPGIIAVSKKKGLRTKKLAFQPDYAVPPEATLAETLEAKGMLQAELAIRTGLAEKTISQIVHGAAPITYETALKLEAALEVFSAHGFRGSTIDQIAEAAGMSKPNLLYYFRGKEDIHETLIKRLLDTWLAPLREMAEDGDPLTEIRSYIHRKLEMARDYPRESRLFANEIIQGAPRIMPMLEGELKSLVDEKAGIILGWIRAGTIARIDPWHLIFSIWATTQHYADFDVQVRAVLGPDRGGDGRFEDAARFLEQLYVEGLRVKD
jgi:TetR/AcrR family transcriptional regulator